jgi:cytochrome P450
LSTTVHSTETTANTLAATLALLAIHQDIQKEILEQIIDVVGVEREPVSVITLSYIRPRFDERAGSD